MSFTEYFNKGKADIDIFLESLLAHPRPRPNESAESHMARMNGEELENSVLFMGIGHTMHRSGLGQDTPKSMVDAHACVERANEDFLKDNPLGKDGCLMSAYNRALGRSVQADAYIKTIEKFSQQPNMAPYVKTLKTLQSLIYALKNVAPVMHKDQNNAPVVFDLVRLVKAMPPLQDRMRPPAYELH